MVFLRVIGVVVVIDRGRAPKSGSTAAKQQVSGGRSAERVRVMVVCTTVSPTFLAKGSRKARRPRAVESKALVYGSPMTHNRRSTQLQKAHSKTSGVVVVHRCVTKHFHPMDCLFPFMLAHTRRLRSARKESILKGRRSGILFSEEGNKSSLILARNVPGRPLGYGTPHAFAPTVIYIFIYIHSCEGARSCAT